MSQETCFGPFKHLEDSMNVDSTFKQFSEHSLRLVAEHQHASGAFPACPNFEPFRYGFLRDGAFCAYAQLIAGNEGSCRAFLEWGAAAIKPLSGRVADIAKKKWGSEPILDNEFLPARFTLEGEIERTEWPNFQIDCYGTFLWLLTEYIRRSGRKVSPLVEETANLIAKYLDLVWTLSCFDPWEEHRHERHTASLACVYGGLNAAGALFGKSDWIELAARAKEAINRSADRYYPKYLSGGSVDASAMWLAFPYGVVGYDDARFQRTLDEIKLRLLQGGGVARYPEDTYYGGGHWPLLSCWLAIVESRLHERSTALDLLGWARAQADQNGYLPEMSFQYVSKKEEMQRWQNRWGADGARPLLWGHAMFSIACFCLSEA